MPFSSKEHEDEVDAFNRRIVRRQAELDREERITKTGKYAPAKTYEPLDLPPGIPELYMMDDPRAAEYEAAYAAARAKRDASRNCEVRFE